jgi:hypothetical protein
MAGDIRFAVARGPKAPRLKSRPDLKLSRIGPTMIAAAFHNVVALPKQKGL